MVKKIVAIGISALIIIPLLIVSSTIFAIRYDKTNRLLNDLEKKNTIHCVQIDEYFNEKGNIKPFYKLNLFPFLSRINSKFIIYTFNYLVGSANETRIVYLQDLPKEYSFDFSDRAVVDVKNKLFVLSQEMCPYANGTCKQDLYVHYYDDFGTKGEVVPIPKEYKPIIEKKVYEGLLEGGVKGKEILSQESEKSVHLKSIEGVIGETILFSLSKGNKLVYFDTINKKWGVANNTLFQKVSSLNDVFIKNTCAYYPSMRGSYIFLKEGYMALIK